MKWWMEFGSFVNRRVLRSNILSVEKGFEKSFLKGIRKNNKLKGYSKS
jgi:hypothetical protein